MGKNAASHRPSQVFTAGFGWRTPWTASCRSENTVFPRKLNATAAPSRTGHAAPLDASARSPTHPAVVGVVSGLCLLRLDVVSSVLETLKATPVVRVLIPAKATIPLGRFTGADRMGEHAGELLARLSERRPQKPFVLTPHYGRAAHLEFYMPGQPTVHCVSAFVAGGRRSQYDYWQATDLRGAMHLLGKDALIVGGYRVEDWQPYFERVELLGRLDGDGKADRPAFYGSGAAMSPTARSC